MTCEKDSEPIRNKDWLFAQPERCYDECLIKLGLVFAIHHGPGRFECITADPGSTTVKCLCECNNKYHSFTWEECKYVHRFSILGVSYYPETILRIGKEVSNNFR